MQSSNPHSQNIYVRGKTLGSPASSGTQIITSQGQQLQFLPRGVLQLHPSQIQQRMPSHGTTIIQQLPTLQQQTKTINTTGGMGQNRRTHSPQNGQLTLKVSELPQTSSSNVAADGAKKQNNEIVIEILKVGDQTVNVSTAKTLNQQPQQIQQIQPAQIVTSQGLSQRRVVLSPGTAFGPRGTVVRSQAGPQQKLANNGSVIVGRQSGLGGPITILRPARPSSAVTASTAAVQLIKQQEQIIRLSQQQQQLQQPQQIVIQQRPSPQQPQLIRLQSIASQGKTILQQQKKQPGQPVQQLKVHQLLQMRQHQQQQQQVVQHQILQQIPQTILLPPGSSSTPTNAIPISATVLPSTSGTDSSQSVGVPQQITITPYSGANTSIRPGPNSVWDFISTGQPPTEK
jgi:hypothetical protein